MPVKVRVTLLDLSPRSWYIPVQTAAATHTPIGKAVQFFHREAPPVPCSRHHPAARSAEVNSDESNRAFHVCFLRNSMIWTVRDETNRSTASSFKLRGML